MSMIGQIGEEFYSTYLVAEMVVHLGEKEINDDKDYRPKKEDKGFVKKVDEEKKTKSKKKKKIQEVFYE
uniref:Uncharacterized protein n=1 Tax=Populus trichocarpa TaxID=3694 RepID=B9IJY2_POPTR